MIPLKFYIVENEPLITASISILLEKQGYVVCGDSGEYKQALSEIIDLQPDVVLLDIRLDSKKNGIDLALQLDLHGLKYLYLSSLADPITQAQIKKTHPLGFIDKPFTEFGLQNKIIQYCNVT